MQRRRNAIRPSLSRLRPAPLTVLHGAGTICRCDSRLQRNTMAKPLSKQRVVCVDNAGHMASLEKLKIYIALRDPNAEIEAPRAVRLTPKKRDLNDEIPF